MQTGLLMKKMGKVTECFKIPPDAIPLCISKAADPEYRTDRSCALSVKGGNLVLVMFHVHTALTLAYCLTT